MRRLQKLSVFATRRTLSVLEFSQVGNAMLARLYDGWSFNVLPRLGQLVAGDADSYRYLVESIRTFPAPEILADMFAAAGFAQVRVRRLSGGIACIPPDGSWTDARFGHADVSGTLALPVIGWHLGRAAHLVIWRA